MQKKKVIGYTCGVYDLFHIGHVTMLRSAKGMCDKLIVAVTEDEIMMMYKNKKAVIPFHERIEVVRSCKYVDVAIPQRDHDKHEAWKKLKYDILFVGDDWYGDKQWQTYESKLSKDGVKVVYFPYHKGTSSSLINQILLKKRNET